MLRAHFVVRPNIAPFEQRPKALNAVCVGLVSHVLLDAVADNLMVFNPVIAAVFIAVDLGSGGSAVGYKAAEGRAVGAINDGRLNRVGFPILHANHRRLAECPASALDLLAVAKNLVDRGQIAKMDDKRYVLSFDPAPNSGAVDEDTESQPVPPDPDEEWPPPPPPDLDDVESEW